MPAAPRRGNPKDAGGARVRGPLAAIAVLVAALILAACGDDAEPATTTSAAETTSTAASTSTLAQADASDAAAAVPEDGAAGEVPNDGAVQIDPATGQPVTPGTTSTTTTSVADESALPPSTTTIPAPTAPTPADSAASTEGILQRPFAATSPWNTQVSGAAVDPDSGRLLRKATRRVAVVERDGKPVQQTRTIEVGLTVNVTRWTVPVFSDNQPGAVARVAVCRQFDCGPDAVTSLTIPPDACPDPQYDGWMTVLDTGARFAYDLWRARCEVDGSLSYHYVKKWELDGPGYQQPTGVSARGSGLPLFAGLITPAEIRAGRIEHALAISVPGAAQRRYVQPASRTDGVGAVDSLPEGARLRLQPGAAKLLTDTFVRSGTERAAAKTVIDALQRYGAIVVDRSAAPTMYAQRNYDWTGLLPLNLLQDIPLERFDVLQLDEVLLDPPRAGEEPVALPEGTPPSIPTTTGGSQVVIP